MDAATDISDPITRETIMDFLTTGTGKFRFKSGGTNHNNGSKSNANKRRLHSPKIARDGLAARLKKLAPYKLGT